MGSFLYSPLPLECVYVYRRAPPVSLTDTESNHLQTMCMVGGGAEWKWEEGPQGRRNEKQGWRNLWVQLLYIGIMGKLLMLLVRGPLSALCRPWGILTPLHHTTCGVRAPPSQSSHFFKVVSALWASLKGVMIGSSKPPWTTGGNELDSYHLPLVIKVHHRLLMDILNSTSRLERNPAVVWDQVSLQRHCLIDICFYFRAGEDYMFSIFCSFSAYLIIGDLKMTCFQAF